MTTSSAVRDRWIFAIIVLAVLVLCGQGLNWHGLEFRDDEVFYVRATQEMLRDGNLLSPTYFGQDRFQKPILFYWLVMFSYKLFGTGWEAARYVSVLFAALSAGVTWLLGARLFNRTTAALGVAALLSSPMFFRHARNAVPDMAMNFFIVLAVYALVVYLSDRRNSMLAVFYLSSALGFMVKGYMAVLLPLALMAYAYWRYREWGQGPIPSAQLGPGAVIVATVIVPWFAYMGIVHGWDYFRYMITDETFYRVFNSAEGSMVISKIGTFFKHSLFYLGVIANYFAPWAAVLMITLLFRCKSDREKEAERLLWVWAAIVFVFFSCLYFKISHYMLILSTPVALLVGHALYQIAGQCDENRLARSGLIFLFCALTVLLVLMFFFIAQFLSDVPSLILWISLSALVFIFGVMRRSLLKWPAGFACALIIFQSQLFRLAEAGLTTHQPLSVMAEKVREHPKLPQYAVAVGSHDIHEKEWQVYFPEIQVQKPGNASQEITGSLIHSVFVTHQEVYLLLTKADYERHISGRYDKVEILDSQRSLRKRFQLDMKFLKSVWRNDKSAVQSYLFEDLILVRCQRV